MLQPDPVTDPVERQSSTSTPNSFESLVEDVLVEDVEDVSEDSSIVTAEVVESGYESNSDVESVQSEFTSDAEIMEVWTRDYSLTLEQNFTPPSERHCYRHRTTPNPAALFQAIESGINPYLYTDDDWTMASTNSFDSYNHRQSWSPDNATNNPELEVRLW